MVVTRVLVEVTPGIWRWTAPHPEWRPRHAWGREVASFAVVAGRDLVLIDPMPPDWEQLDELVKRGDARRLAILLTIHYHVRATALVYERYAADLEVSVHAHPSVAALLGPDVPMEPIEPGGPLPLGVQAARIGSPRRRETPLYLPFADALAFGDAVVGVDGELRVWEEIDDKRRDWYERRFLPTLRPLLDLDPAHVLVTHGPPVIGGGRAALEKALEAPPWSMRRG
jgi:hypothetical protein